MKAIPATPWTEGVRGPVALGFRVRTGRASAVALGGATSSPRVLERRELRLHDPGVPGSGQPYHLGLEAPPDQAEAAVRRATEAARKVAIPAVRDFVGGIRSRTDDLRGAGIVGGSDTDPSTIANPHMRAHASEGRLFPDLVAEALGLCEVPCSRWVERGLDAAAGKALGLSAAEMKQALAEMGRAVGAPWRALEKAAALAAWMILARGARRG